MAGAGAGGRGKRYSQQRAQNHPILQESRSLFLEPLKKTQPCSLISFFKKSKIALLNETNLRTSTQLALMKNQIEVGMSGGWGLNPKEYSMYLRSFFFLFLLCSSSSPPPLLLLSSSSFSSSPPPPFSSFCLPVIPTILPYSPTALWFFSLHPSLWRLILS